MVDIWSSMSSIDAVQRTCEKSGISIVVWSQYYSEVTTPLMCITCTAYAHLERYRRLQSIWYCCWYSMINYYDLWYRFLGGLKQPTHCNVVWCALPTILVVDALDLQQQRILVLLWSPSPTIPYNWYKQYDIWSLQRIICYVGLEIRYDIRFRLQQQNSRWIVTTSSLSHLWRLWTSILNYVIPLNGYVLEKCQMVVWYLLYPR